MKVNNQNTNNKPEVRLLPKPDRMHLNKAYDEWRNIPWRKLERKVYKLQRRIYTASQRGETLKVRKLQRLLMKSRAAKLLSVRRITQENKGVRRESRTLGASALNNWRAVSPGELSLSVPT